MQHTQPEPVVGNTIMVQPGFTVEDMEARQKALRDREPYKYWFDTIRSLLTARVREGGSRYVIIGYSNSQDPYEYLDQLHDDLIETYKGAATVSINPEYPRGVKICLRLWG